MSKHSIDIAIKEKQILELESNVGKLEVGKHDFIQFSILFTSL